MSQLTRRVDEDNDWSFGQGRSDYVSGLAGVAQNLRTRLQSFLGNCFFDLNAGIDWFNLDGSKELIEANLAVRAVILNTKYITGIQELSLILTEDRNYRLSYRATCVFPGTLRQNFGVLLTEGGDILITEDGDTLNA